MFIIVFTINLVLTSANQDCTNNYKLPKYYLVEKCHRSKLGIAAYANFTSLRSCQRLGIEKKGLALNFSPPEAREGGMNQYSCEVLRCAETEGGRTLVNDTRFDYYSLYARPLPSENSTCVPATGMFFLIPDLENYTDAQLECMNMTGIIADVITEQRTETLAQVLVEASVEAAYVGMRRYNKSSFVSVNDSASFDCSTYRAWAPGHPNRNFYKYDCMLITRHKTWKTTSCSKPHHALCELLPKGPYKRGSMFATRRKNDSEVEETQEP